MKKFFFALVLSLFINEAKSNIDRIRITYRADPSTTAVISWDQVSGEMPVLYYGTTDKKLKWNKYPNKKSVDLTTSAANMNNNFVRLTDLKPNTNYYFVIKDSKHISKRYWFKTFPDNPNVRLSFVAGGDSRTHADVRRNGNKMVAKLRPHAVLFDGDYMGRGTPEEWKEWFDDWQLTITPDNRIIPIVAAKGNHEPSSKDMVELFDIPHDKIYYTLNFGGNLFRLHVLNSDTREIGGAQTKWLEKELKNRTNAIFTSAMYHKPFRPHFASKSEGKNGYKYWAPLFYRYRLDLAIEADSHVGKWTWPIVPSNSKKSDEGFIRDDEDGTVYIGEGCWGAPLRKIDDGKEWTRGMLLEDNFNWMFIDNEKIEIRKVKFNNVDEVASVKENNVFAIPANIDIWSNSNDSVLHIYKRKFDPDKPVVTIIKPAADKVSYTLDEIKIEADAKDSDGSIKKVEFFIDDELFFSDEAPPYEVNFKPNDFGKYGLVVKAFDDEGKSSKTISTLHFERENIALNKPVTSNDIEGNDSPERINDGDTDSRWTTEEEDNKWISIDLEKVEVIEKIIIHWETAFGKEYKVLISEDGTEYKELYSETNGNGDSDEINFDPVSARYIKLDCVTRGTKWGFSVWEFEVFRPLN